MDTIFLVSLLPLSNIEITNYFNYKARFNGLFSGNNLSITKEGAHVTTKIVKEYIAFYY